MLKTVMSAALFATVTTSATAQSGRTIPSDCVVKSIEGKWFMELLPYSCRVLFDANGEAKLLTPSCLAYASIKLLEFKLKVAMSPSCEATGHFRYVLQVGNSRVCKGKSYPETTTFDSDLQLWRSRDASRIDGPGNYKQTDDVGPCQFNEIPGTLVHHFVRIFR